MGGAGGAGGAGAGGAGGAEGLAPFASIQQLHGRMNEFWERKNREVEKLDPSDENETEFKTYELPLARIKKIMKLDDSVKALTVAIPVALKLIPAEPSPVLFQRVFLALVPAVALILAWQMPRQMLGAMLLRLLAVLVAACTT
ncbi:NFYC, partial [Symbiodinium sp. KB8]